MNIAMQYLDTENKKRWGYITEVAIQRFAEYHNKLRELKSDNENEILRKSVEILSKEKVELFLLDGRTGSVEIRALSVITPFAKHENLTIMDQDQE